MGSTLTNLLYHIVFSTKERRKFITADLQFDLYDYIGGIIRSEKGRSIKIGGTIDHIHILSMFSPVASISSTVKNIKGGSSKWINEHLHSFQPFAWQTGYAAFSVSESGCEKIAEYIENQEEHHKGLSFQDKLRALLKKNNSDYDEKYIWR